MIEGTKEICEYLKVEPEDYIHPDYPWCWGYFIDWYLRDNSKFPDIPRGLRFVIGKGGKGNYHHYFKGILDDTNFQPDQADIEQINFICKMHNIKPNTLVDGCGYRWGRLISHYLNSSAAFPFKLPSTKVMSETFPTHTPGSRWSTYFKNCALGMAKAKNTRASITGSTTKFRSYQNTEEGPYDL